MTLEILNLSYNQVERFTPEVAANLKNLSTIDLSNNELNSLRGFECFKRLKRCILKHNHLDNLKELAEISTLIEIDIEGNQVESMDPILEVLKGKKDILVVNLKGNQVVS